MRCTMMTTKRNIAAAGVAAALALVLAPATATADPWWKRAGRYLHDNGYVRGAGVAHVATLEQSREMELADIDGAASLAVQDGPIEGSGAAASSKTIFALNLGLRLPVLNRRLALEAVAGLPFKVEFSATGTLANESIAPTALGIPTGVPALGEQLGEASAVPLVFTAVYRFLDAGVLQPYAGAGPALMLTTDRKVTNPILTEVSEPEMDIAPAPGLVLQAGLDVKVWRQVYARVDVKYIAFMLARAEVHHVQVRTPSLPLFEAVEVGTAKMSLWVNPLIVQAGLGFDFSIF
ncbi:MAG TPA: OmpW family outer membrane protein [Kofleriaceae bacterium]|nr:OmpW family outer membrane protein [Kofleriaceae bacterium]